VAAGFNWDARRREHLIDGVPIHLVGPDSLGGPPLRVSTLRGVKVIGLVDLVRGKLTVGLETIRRAKDIADVIELIRVVPLKKNFAPRLPRNCALPSRNLSIRSTARDEPSSGPSDSGDSKPERARVQGSASRQRPTTLPSALHIKMRRLIPRQPANTLVLPPVLLRSSWSLPLRSRTASAVSTSAHLQVHAIGRPLRRGRSGRRLRSASFTIARSACAAPARAD